MLLTPPLQPVAIAFGDGGDGTLDLRLLPQHLGAFESPGGDQRVEAVSLLIRADVDGYVFYFLNLTEDHFERLTYLVRRLTGS